MASHDGHRQRLKKRYIEEGLESFADHEVLELLMYYCIPRIDTNDIAHNLIDTFGSLPGVLEASADELQKVEGVGPVTAHFLTLLNEVNRYYRKEKAKSNKPLESFDQFGQILVPKFLGRRNEMVYLLCLDAKCKVICCRLVGEGSTNSAGLSVRKIVETALAVNATSVVLAHNHPDGVATPSRDDVRATVQISQALRTVGVVLIDHIIVADEEYISMAMTGAFKQE